jgi:hypothetical protein
MPVLCERRCSLLIDPNPLLAAVNSPSAEHQWINGVVGYLATDFGKQVISPFDFFNHDSIHNDDS